MRKAGNIFLLAIVIGAFTAALVYRHLRTQREQMEAMRRAAEHATVAVLVANDVIPIGSRLEPGQVRLVAWPVEARPEGAIGDPGVAVGNIARTTIGKNEPILGTELAAQGSGLLPLMITEGMRGMSVKVDSVTGVSGFITPNSRVDVLVAGNPDDNGGQAQHSKVVLQNIKVLATGKSIEQKDDKPVEVPTVTLLVSPEDAEKLTLAARYDPVRLALRNYRDQDVVRTSGVSAKELFHDHAEPTPIPPKAVSRVARIVGYTVEVLLGEKVTRQGVL